jgi:hypothetical protein
MGVVSPAKIVGSGYLFRSEVGRSALFFTPLLFGLRQAVSMTYRRIPVLDYQKAARRYSNALAKRKQIDAKIIAGAVFAAAVFCVLMTTVALKTIGH